MPINFDIKKTNIELTPAIKSYLLKRLSKLDKFVAKDDGVHGQVEIGITTKGQHSGDIYRAEINLHIPGKDFRAVSERDDLYAAIDEARDEMLRSIRSYKDKKRSLLKRGGYQVKKLLKFRGKKLR